MTDKLIIQQTGGERTSFVLASTEVLIGRSSEAHLRLDDPCVSKRHCQLRKESAGWFLEDLGSSNGTFFSGKRLTGRVRMRHGQAFSVGNITLVLDEGRKIPQPAFYAVYGAAAALILGIGLFYLFHFYHQKPRRIFGGGGSVSAARSSVDVSSFVPADGNLIRMEVPPLPQNTAVKLKKRTIKIRGKLVLNRAN